MIMTVKYLSDLEKPECRNLWEEAFPEDSPSFVDYYYRDKCADNRILALGENEGQTFHVLAMLQQNPYLMQVGRKRLTIDYLVGIATAEDRRHRGYMAMLLSKFLKDSREDQVPFTFLMPADEAIYRPFGFTWIFDQPHWEWKEDARRDLVKRPLLPWHDQESFHRRAAEAAAYMDAWLSARYTVYTVRSTEYLYRLLNEIASEDGTFDVYYRGEEIVGVESIWGLSEREQRLLYADDAYAEETGAVKPAIMARLITPEKIMREISLPQGEETEDKTIRIRITDALLDDNNADWNWTLTPLGSRVERIFDDTPQWSAAENPVDLVLSIEELTSWLFGYAVPEAAREYEKFVQPLSKVFLDEVV